MKMETNLRRGLIIMSALFVVQLAFAMTRQPPPVQLTASWVNNPHSMEELMGLSDDVVHARVRSVERAQPMVTEAPGEPEGHDEIPMEVVTLEVVDRIGGKSNARGQTIQLFHTGMSKATPPTELGRRPPGPPPEGVNRPASPPALGAADSRTIILSDDPPYERGQEYVLMLRQGPEVRVGGRSVRTQRVVSPEGRYRVQGGRVTPISSRAEFAREQRGRSVDALKEHAQRGLRNARAPQNPWEQRGR